MDVWIDLIRGRCRLTYFLFSPKRTWKNWKTLERQKTVHCTFKLLLSPPYKLVELFRKENGDLTMLQNCNLHVNVQHDTSFSSQMGAIPSGQETDYEYKVIQAGICLQKMVHGYNRICKNVKNSIFCFLISYIRSVPHTNYNSIVCIHCFNF